MCEECGCVQGVRLCARSALCVCACPCAGAPEVISRCEYREANDYYAIGGILMELLLGRPPLRDAKPGKREKKEARGKVK